MVIEGWAALVEKTSPRRWDFRGTLKSGQAISKRGDGHSRQQPCTGTGLVFLSVRCKSLPLLKTSREGNPSASHRRMMFAVSKEASRVASLPNDVINP